MADCKSCKEHRKDPENVTYIVHESAMARNERKEKRMWVTIWLLIVLLVGSNIGWMVYENSFEDVVVTQENADGYNNFIGNDGDILNGEANSQDPA